MSLLALNELRGQLQRRDERIAELEAEIARLRESTENNKPLLALRAGD